MSSDPIFPIEPALDAVQWKRHSIRPELEPLEWQELVRNTSDLLRLIFTYVGGADELIQKAKELFEESPLQQYLESTTDNYLAKLGKIYEMQSDIINQYADGQVDLDQFISMVLITSQAASKTGQGIRAFDGMLRVPIKNIQDSIRRIKNTLEIG